LAVVINHLIGLSKERTDNMDLTTSMEIYRAEQELEDLSRQTNMTDGDRAKKKQLKGKVRRLKKKLGEKPFRIAWDE
jgi:hypothetical protein